MARDGSGRPSSMAATSEAAAAGPQRLDRGHAHGVLVALPPESPVADPGQARQLDLDPFPRLVLSREPAALLAGGRRPGRARGARGVGGDQGAACLAVAILGAHRLTAIRVGAVQSHFACHGYTRVIGRT